MQDRGAHQCRELESPPAAAFPRLGRVVGPDCRLDIPGFQRDRVRRGAWRERLVAVGPEDFGECRQPPRQRHSPRHREIDAAIGDDEVQLTPGVEDGQEVDDNIFRTQHRDDIDHPQKLMQTPYEKMTTACRRNNRP